MHYFNGKEYFQSNGSFHNIELNKLGVCTGIAAVMTGKHYGVVHQIKAVAPQVASTHCFLHRDALATKDMEPPHHHILQ